MTTPTASEIIERVKARYAGCRTYQDEGEQSTRFDHDQPDATHRPHTNRLKFRSAYERGGRFIFEYRGALLHEPEAEWTCGAVWSDGKAVQRYGSIPSPPSDAHCDLDHALGAFQGVSGRTSSEIPSLLLTGTKLHARIASLGTASVWPTAVSDGVECVRLGAAWPDRATTLTVWIDVHTDLVRRIDERHEVTTDFVSKMLEDTRRGLEAEGTEPAKLAAILKGMEESQNRLRSNPFTTESTTVWHPRMDHDIDPKMFEFVPPG